MCEIGKPLEIVNVEPLALPKPLRREEPQQEPNVVPVEAPVTETTVATTV